MRFPEKKPKFPIIEVHDQADQDPTSENQSSTKQNLAELAGEVGCVVGSQLLKKFTLGLAKNLLRNVCGAPGKAKGGLIKKKPKDESMAHEGKESKKKEVQETKLEKKGYKETISGKMVKKAKGGLIKGMPKIALRGY